MERYHTAFHSMGLTQFFTFFFIPVSSILNPLITTGSHEVPNEEECIPEFSYPSYVKKHFQAEQDDMFSFKDSPRMGRPSDSTYKKLNSVVSMTSVESEITLFLLSMADLISSTLVSVMAIFGGKFIYKGLWWAILLLIVILGTMAVSAFILCKQPQNPSKLLYKSSGVLMFPLLSLTFNIFSADVTSC